MAMISILSLYNYDNSIFNDFEVPEGMDKDNTIDNILLECAELLSNGATKNRRYGKSSGPQKILSITQYGMLMAL